MALMDSRSSEALARRASVSMLGETAKRLPLRGLGLSLDGAKWWSQGCLVHEQRRVLQETSDSVERRNFKRSSLLNTDVSTMTW
jgi:hypothetical protein